MNGSSNNILCANCGGVGHIYRVCNYPICSFGIICCRIAFDTAQQMLVPEYLMVQRKDSLCFVEFIRAKWVPQNRQYLMKLFACMTPSERNRIKAAADFDELWYGFWHNDACRSYMKEYQQARDQFDVLKKGFSLRCADTGGVIRFSLDYLLAHTSPNYEDTEWGWPKGRRNINETDLRCAIREFVEETGVPSTDVSVLTHMKPFEEVFYGCNHVRYRHVYYIAVVHGNATGKEPAVNVHSAQGQEIGNIAWCTADVVMKNTREYNVERRELFKRVHHLITSNLLNITLVAGNTTASLASPSPLLRRVQPPSSVLAETCDEQEGEQEEDSSEQQVDRSRDGEGLPSGGL